jgi:hypothetical protein
MSIVVDSQDLRGYLRGICLVAAVRVIDMDPTRGSFARALSGLLGDDTQLFLRKLSLFSGVDASSLRGAIDELYEADDEYLQADNINLQLGLLSGRPVPIFPFVRSNQVRQAALWRPFLESARNLAHAAVRLRMQQGIEERVDGYWPCLSSFLGRVGGNSELSYAISVATISDVVSDIIFYNSSISTRTENAVVVQGSNRVISELESLDIQSLYVLVRGAAFGAEK